MGIVKESILFQRGLDPKKALDVGVKRSSTIKDFIERGLEKFLINYTPRFCVTREDGTKNWVYFYEKGEYLKDYRSVIISIDIFFWNSHYKKTFKKDVKEWFNDNGFKIITSKYNNKSMFYEISFDDK